MAGQIDVLYYMGCGHSLAWSGGSKVLALRSRWYSVSRTSPAVLSKIEDSSFEPEEVLLPIWLLGPSQRESRAVSGDIEHHGTETVHLNPFGILQCSYESSLKYLRPSVSRGCQSISIVPRFSKTAFSQLLEYSPGYSR